MIRARILPMEQSGQTTSKIRLSIGIISVALVGVIVLHSIISFASFVVHVVFIFYIVFLIAGAVVASLRAFQYWRGKADNANKLAVLLVARTMIDLLSVGIMLWLSINSIADEWSILFAALIIVGVYSMILLLFETKLATGMFLRHAKADSEESA